jgi:hypothetical protein
MSFPGKLAAVVLVLFLLAEVDVIRSDTAPPQEQLKTYALPNGTQSADISPDEQFVVTASNTTKPHAADSADSKTKAIVDVVQLWNFKEGKLRAEFTAQESEVRVAPKGYLLDQSRTEPIVRFSPDGGVVIALIDRTINILRGTDLTELRAFPIVAPESVMRTSPDGRTVVHEPSIRAMEISPSGKTVAVLWPSEMIHGRVQLYRKKCMEPGYT